MSTCATHSCLARETCVAELPSLLYQLSVIQINGDFRSTWKKLPWNFFHNYSHVQATIRAGLDLCSLCTLYTTSKGQRSLLPCQWQTQLHLQIRNLL